MSFHFIFCDSSSKFLTACLKYIRDINSHNQYSVTQKCWCQVSNALTQFHEKIKLENQNLRGH